MTIDLKPATQALLQKEAQRQGRPADDVAEDLLERALTVAERDFEETVQGIERGVKASEEGRERPIAEYIEDVRRRRLARDSVAGA